MLRLFQMLLFQMQSPGAEQCMSVVCKTGWFLAFTEYKIVDFMKVALCNWGNENWVSL